MVKHTEFFWGEVIGAYWRVHRPSEPDIMSERLAVHYLRTFAGFSTEQLSARLGVSNFVVTNWEARGGPFRRENLQALERLCKSFSLSKTAEYFHGLDLALAFRKSRKGKKFGSLDVIGGRA